MDTNATLLAVIENANQIIKDYDDPEGNGVDQDDANSLAESILSLNAWLSKGGFLPRNWLRSERGDVFTEILYALEDNESRCCDNEADRQYLAEDLATRLVR